MTTIGKHPEGSVGWFDLMTRDVAAARSFYGGLLGWTFGSDGTDGGGYAMGTVGGRHAAGMGELPKDADARPAWTPYFITADLERTIAAIGEHGGSGVLGPIDVGEPGRMALAVDPTGASFGVWEPKAHTGAQVVDEPGAMAWCEVNTRDAARARDFYATVFGLEARKLEAPGMEYWTLHAGDRPIGGVLQMDAHWPAEVPPHWMIYFQTEATEAACARAKELGGKVCVPPFDTPYGRIAVLEDAGGAVFSVMQPPAGS